MPDTIVTALIGATGTVCGALVPQLFTALKNRELYSPITTEKQQGVIGLWVGKGWDTWVENESPILNSQLLTK